MSDPIDIPVLNQDFTNEKISMPYPHVVVLEPSDAIALVLPSLPKGDLAVICVVDGVTKQIGSIRNSAIDIHHLMKVTKLNYVKSSSAIFNVRTTQDVVDVLAT